MNMCLLEVAMSEKCRISHFQSKEGWVVKSLRTGEVKDVRTGGLPIWGGATFDWGGGQYPITCHDFSNKS